MGRAYQYQRTTAAVVEQDLLAAAGPSTCTSRLEIDLKMRREVRWNEEKGARPQSKKEVDEAPLQVNPL